MSFVEDALSLKSKLHLGRFSSLQLAGVGLLVAAVLVVASATFLEAQGAEGFQVHSAQAQGQERSQSQDQGQAGSEAGAGAERSSSDQAEGGASSGEGDVASVTSGEGGSASGSDALCVDVAGAVASPGLYRLQAGSRVDDAIKAAGGLAENAHRESVNLARPLSDGEQLVVPTKEQASAAQAPGSASVESGPSATSAGSSGGRGAGATTASGNVSGGKVNINTASASELTSLKGVGEATAEKIVAYREANGPFKKPEDLKRVSGIGDKKFEAVKDAITV